MDYVAKMLHEKLRWDDKLAAHPDAWRQQWSDPFLDPANRHAYSA